MELAQTRDNTPTTIADNCTSLLLRLFEAGHSAVLDELRTKGSNRGLLHSNDLDQLYSIDGLVLALGQRYERDDITQALRTLSERKAIELKKYNDRLWSIRLLPVSFGDRSRLKGGGK